jgi:hypothetical protein
MSYSLLTLYSESTASCPEKERRKLGLSHSSGSKWEGLSIERLRQIGLLEKKEVFRCTRETLSEYCLLRGDVRVDLPKGTIRLYAEEEDTGTRTELIQPYPRRWDDPVMIHISNVSVSSVAGKESAPRCRRVHSVPAVLVSAGGKSGRILKCPFSSLTIAFYRLVNHMA